LLCKPYDFEAWIEHHASLLAAACLPRSVPIPEGRRGGLQTAVYNAFAANLIRECISIRGNGLSLDRMRRGCRDEHLDFHIAKSDLN
jgi:hypothetical protein